MKTDSEILKQIVDIVKEHYPIIDQQIKEAAAKHYPQIGDKFKDIYGEKYILAGDDFYLHLFSPKTGHLYYICESNMGVTLDEIKGIMSIKYDIDLYITKTNK